MRIPTLLALCISTFALLVPTALLPLTAEAGSTGSRSSIGHAGPQASELPAVLRTPWAARAGFDPIHLLSVPESQPASGDVRVHLTLVPRSSGLFHPLPHGAIGLSREVIADRYGRSPGEYLALEQYFGSFGLSLGPADPMRLSLSVHGPSDSVAAAFHTSLRTGAFGGTEVRFPSTIPALPSPWSGMVSAVSGLSDGFDRFALPLRDPHPILPAVAPASLPARSTNQLTPSAAHLAYGLNDLYNFSGGTHFATGEGIVLLLWGRGFDPNDIQTFFSQDYPQGFPPVDVRWYPIDQSVSPNASAVSDPSAAPRELTLDIEWAGSSAPGATLDAVYAPDGPASRGYSPSDATMEDALNTAVSLPSVRAISMSFGTPDGADPAFQAAFETGFAVASQRGITLLAASGDNGGASASGTCPAGGPPPQYPAASPQVVAVGGTSVTLNLSVLGGVTGVAQETAWNGSGGGFSSSYSAPSWQSLGSAGAVVTAGGHRGIPDVSGPAAYDRFYYAGRLMAGNGTSFATPFWAGIVAEMDGLLSAPLGALSDRLYYIGSQEENHTKAQGLVDIRGETGPACWSSAAGYDLSTGWGSPRAGLLFEDLEGTFVDISLAVDPNPVAPGGTETATIVVTNSSSHQPIPGLSVSVALTSTDGYLGPCGGTLASSTQDTDALGALRIGLSVPFCYFGDSLTVSVQVLSGGYFGSQSSGVSVNLLGLSPLLSAAGNYPYNFLLFALVMGAAVTVGILGGGRPIRPRKRVAPPGPPVAVSSPGPAMPPGTDAAEPPDGALAERPASAEPDAPRSTTEPAPPLPEESGADLSPDPSPPTEPGPADPSEGASSDSESFSGDPPSDAP